jgi:site-specific DNA-methyltransferase (adenine-specific)
MIELNRIYNEDCLEGMKRIPDKSIDMILCDLPYGTTRNKWDEIIPFEPLWEQYERVAKPNCPIILTSNQPFTTQLINSNRKLFKYDLVWQKTHPKGHLNAKRMPMRAHEEILIFYKKPPVYNPIMRKGKYRYKGNKGFSEERCYGTSKPYDNWNDEYYPTSVIEISNAVQIGKIHPTQKPVELFEWLINTYSNEGDLILDNCIGSGTTAIACINTGRNFIGFELDKHYCDIANERIRKALAEKAVGE